MADCPSLVKIEDTIFYDDQARRGMLIIGGDGGLGLGMEQNKERRERE